MQDEHFSHLSSCLEKLIGCSWKFSHIFGQGSPHQ